MTEKTLPIGQRVVVSPKHWLRAGSIGTVTEFDPKKFRYFVEFDQTFAGGGIEGKGLWLDGSFIEPLRQQPSTKRSKKTQLSPQTIVNCQPKIDLTKMPDLDCAPQVYSCKNCSWVGFKTEMSRSSVTGPNLGLEIAVGYNCPLCGHEIKL